MTRELAGVFATVSWAALTVVVFACQGHAGKPQGSGHATVADASLRDASVGIEDTGSAAAKPAAVPAWQAVVDRTRYLDRRGQSGVVYGVLGAIVAPPYQWLVDDTEGNGALAIHVTLPPRALAVPGDRVALAGAWAIDGTRAWYWRASVATPLPPAPATKAKDPPAEPGHTIQDGELPGDAQPISKAKEAEPAYFTVVGDAPVIDGDGWLVADTSVGRPYALLNLPGERASFGAQDLRAPNERWSLKRGETYWVRIGPVHRHGADKLVTINARTAPIRVAVPGKAATRR